MDRKSKITERIFCFAMILFYKPALDHFISCQKYIKKVWLSPQIQWCTYHWATGQFGAIWMRRMVGFHRVVGLHVQRTPGSTQSRSYCHSVRALLRTTCVNGRIVIYLLPWKVWLLIHVSKIQIFMQKGTTDYRRKKWFIKIYLLEMCTNKNIYNVQETHSTKPTFEIYFDFPSKNFVIFPKKNFWFFTKKFFDFPFENLFVFPRRNLR